MTAVSSKTANGQFKNYASNFDYTAAGAIKSMMLGNGRWETAQYNERLQLTQIGLGSSATDTSSWKANYEYGELNADGTVDAAKNTGSVAKQTVTLPTMNFVQTYKFDELNRLTEAKETTNGTQNWIQTFGYDRYGNRTGFYQQIGGVATAQTPTVDANTNRFTTGQGYVYDLNGNLIQDAEGRTFTFNGDDKQTQVKDANNNIVGTYFYDGGGARVKKVTYAETTIFVYDGGGNLAAEYSTAAPPSVPTTSYLTTDNLGSPRVITDKTGTVTARRDFMPFGENLYAGTGARSASLKYSSLDTDNIRQRYTGYEKDGETQLDFAEARMYQSRHGRFTAVDPLLSSASLSNPQTFNRYTYTGNNPINYTDPSGLDYYKDRNGGVYYFAGSGVQKDADGNILQNITGLSGTVTIGGNINGQSFNAGDFVEYGANSIKLIDAATMTPAQVTGTEVNNTFSEILETTAATVNGIISAHAEDNGFTPLPGPQNSVGRGIGHGLALGQGVTETIIGGGLISGGLGGEGIGLILDATGGGAAVGIPINIASGAVIVTGAVIGGHGVFVTANTILHLFNQSSGSGSSYTPNNTPQGPSSSYNPNATTGRSVPPNTETNASSSSVAKNLQKNGFSKSRSKSGKGSGALNFSKGNTKYSLRMKSSQKSGGGPTLDRYDNGVPSRKIRLK